MPILIAHMDPDSAVPIVAIVFTFIWLIVKALMAPFTQRAAAKAKHAEANQGALSEEEHAALANLERTLANMERRVESLETILIETQRSKENYGTKL
jgi:flagellar biosynthesis/type III secretory pathway M-ring protein FliF/YscJ